ncbi:transmembrane protein 242 isoform X2 [Cephus cinctus]|uniref:Transmembrane protein 242 n=1 Tax=Cephus cinctus TaxID=211228 RepID=A0AAJ7RT17_CEPCN|nr:transmembrane protein 242 isoform X2 [Cephus cinctus]
MSAEAKNVSNYSDAISYVKDDLSTEVKHIKRRKERFQAAVFLSAVTGVSMLIGFGSAVAASKKKDPKFFNEGIAGFKGMTETGGSLAMRALGWGTAYAITGCGILFYSIWKISGASTAEEFRIKMGSILPRIPKNNPPRSRTDFEGLTDLMTYISEDWGKRKDQGTNT